MDDSHRQLPVIDVSPLLGTGPRDGVAQQIEVACRETGFFYITGHGVSDELMGRLDAASRTAPPRTAFTT